MFVILLCILVIGVLEFKALSMGIDGTSLAGCFGAIGGIVGYWIKTLITKKKGGR